VFAKLFARRNRPNVFVARSVAPVDFTQSVRPVADHAWWSDPRVTGDAKHADRPTAENVAWAQVEQAFDAARRP
jgi:hypothetical protein